MRRALTDRQSGGRLHPHFDRLESRQVLSGLTPVLGFSAGILPTQVGTMLPGSSLSIVAIEPVPTSVISQSPSTILITFNHPVDSFSLGNGDFELVHVATDGSTEPLNAGEAKLSEALDANNPTASQVALSLSKPLVDGSYRLLLSANSQIQGVDGSSMTLSNARDMTLSDFTISPVKTGIATAVDLKTIGSTELIQGGVLDLSANPGSVDYYKITLANGHRWRLGLEVNTKNSGSPLTSDLSLFDSQGRLISTNNVGLASDPADPYLFAGLEPGDYFVGLSGRNNIPNASGTYDPSQTVVGADPGGAFELHLVADPADQPTQVTGLRVDHADSLSTAPTGLTLQFSGSILASTLLDTNLPGLTLQDQNGQTWPLVASHYDASLGQLSYLFDQTLPVGTYTLQVPSKGNLIDLTGETPVALDSPSGSLGNFKVFPSTPTPDDLGPFLPTTAREGLVATINVAANSSTTRHFEVENPGIYVISGISPSSSLNYTLLDAQGNVVAAGPSANLTGVTDVSLNTGLYSLVVDNPGNEAAQVPLTIREKEIVYSQLLDSGVGQSSAFSLRLVSSQTNFGAGSDSSPAVVNLTLTGSSPQPFAGGSSSSGTQSTGSLANSSGSTTGATAPVSSTVAGFIYVGVPIGRPSSQSNQISAVGPSGPSGSVALASAGLPGGLIIAPKAIKPDTRSKQEVIPDSPEIPADEVITIPRASSLDAGLLSRGPMSRKNDVRSLNDSDMIDEVVANAFRWIGRPTIGIIKNHVKSLESVAKLEVSDPAGLLSTAPLEEARVEHASLASPITVGVVISAIVYRYRQQIVNWLSRSAGTRSKSQRKPQTLFAGPMSHRRLVRNSREFTSQ